MLTCDACGYRSMHVVVDPVEDVVLCEVCLAYLEDTRGARPVPKGPPPLPPTSETNWETNNEQGQAV